MALDATGEDDAGDARGPAFSSSTDAWAEAKSRDGEWARSGCGAVGHDVDGRAAKSVVPE